MKRSVTGLIARREFRDLLRDRRTVLLILILPVLLYPIFGLVSYVFALSLAGQTSRVGIIGQTNLPASGTPLIAGDAFTKFDAKETAAEAKKISREDPQDGMVKLAVVPLECDETAAQEALNLKKVDVVLIVPATFAADLASGKRPTLTVLDRDGDEKSKLAAARLNRVLRSWEDTLRQAKFEKAGLDKDFDKVFVLKDPQSRKAPEKQAGDELRDLFVKAFPFILIMWLVAGAIQPAVDLTAGEKERGTMETLLISPAERREIVLGKFLAVTLFTFLSVVWNVIWLATAALVLEQILRTSDGQPVQIVNILGLFGCMLLAIPLAMMFSAISLALGVFARSTKEGQYYLMPLILLTMPLAFASMMPGAELTSGKAVVPVTGAMLFQQKLLNVNGDAIPWDLLPLVLGSLGLAVGVALWLAVVQFRRESVLFRETAGKSKGLFGVFSKSG